jgi:RNA polymerase sigma-70 factor, ECF subfamily
VVVDRDHVERARHGDREAYEALARDAAPRLFLVCHRILRDLDRAEDAVQVTLIRIWRELPGLRDPDRFEAWTYRIAVNACYAELRRDRRLVSAVRQLSDRPAGGDPPEGAVADRDAIGRAFGRLTPEHRAVVVLRYFVGLSLGEIAEVVGSPPGTVASRLHYALFRLRRELTTGDLPGSIESGVPA